MSKGMLLFLVGIFLFLNYFQFVSAAHFIVGRVNNALDGESPDGYLIYLWNYENGVLDNLSDIVGPMGNSGQNNIYMIDCELLENPCQIGDNLSLQIIFGQGEYFTPEEINVTVTGSGFDLVGNLTLNGPPVFLGILVDDSLKIVENEVDLVAGNTREVRCVANITDYEGDSIQLANSSFYFNTYNFDTADDNNYHYSNQSCNVNSSFGGENDSQITCTFYLEYYSDPGSWECAIRVEDSNNLKSNSTDLVGVNELLAIGLQNYVDFGRVETGSVSSESQVNVTNYGNVMVNLSLNGYGSEEGDGLAMDCLFGNISVGFLKYNVSSSNEGDLNYQQFENNYSNLTKYPFVNELNLEYRTNDFINDKINSTYWRIYVPGSVAGACDGAIVFGAVKSPAD